MSRKKYSTVKLEGVENLRRILSNCVHRGGLDDDKFLYLIKNVSKTLTNFFTSTSNEVSTDHLPISIPQDDLIGNQELNTYKTMASLTYSTVHFTGFGIRSSLSSNTRIHTVYAFANTHTGAKAIPGSMATNER